MENTFTYNSMINNSYGIDVNEGPINNIDTTNTINSKPIYYITNKQNQVYDGLDAGFVACINCRDVSFKNSLISGAYKGVYFYNTVDSSLINNSIHSNLFGIYFYKSSNNNIQGNNIYSNSEGVYSEGVYFDDGSSTNLVFLNNINSHYKGISIRSLNNASEANIFSDNILTSNFYGIYFLSGGNNNIIKRNKIFNYSSLEGIGIYFSYNIKNNSIYDNYVYYYNGKNAKDLGVNNSWNVTLTSGTNIVGRPFIGGNFWHDYTGIDNNGDGIGDTNLPYTSNGNMPGDWLPLTPPIQCGDTIYNDVALEFDLLNCPGDGLIIGNDNLRLNCNGHKIRGPGGYQAAGIRLQNKHNNIIENCDIDSFAYGVRLDSSSDNIIQNSKFGSSLLDGIVLADSDSNTIKGNELKKEISIAGSDNNIIIDNKIKDLNRCLFTSSSNGNLIYNNYFDCNSNAQSSGVNLWNITKTKGTNIIGGPVISGNYWSDYNGTDLNGDGIGDTNLPYNIGISNGGDYGPLTNTSGRVRARSSPELGIKSSGLQKAFPILFVIILAIIITLIILKSNYNSRKAKHKRIKRR